MKNPSQIVYHYLKPVCYLNGICMDNLCTSVQVIDIFYYLLLEDKERKGISALRKVIIHDNMIWVSY